MNSLPVVSDRPTTGEATPASETANSAIVSPQTLHVEDLTTYLKMPWYRGLAIPLLLAGVSWTLHRQWDSLPWITTFPGLLLLSTIIAAAVTDLRAKKIPNWITYPAVLAALVTGAVSQCATPVEWLGGLKLSEVFSGGLICFLCMLLPYRASGGGAGDVKLAAVIGALLGWQMGLSVIVWAYLMMGAFLLIVQLFTSHPWLLSTALTRSVGAYILPQLVKVPDEKQQRLLRRPIPLGGAFAVGVICVLFGGNLFGA